MSIMTVEEFVERNKDLEFFRKHCMIQGVDYGSVIGDKPALLKPGAEKLMVRYGLSIKTELDESVLNWNGSEPLFYFRYRVCVYQDRVLQADSLGSCNSRETKYRYRWVKDHEVPNELHSDDLHKREQTLEEWEWAIQKAEISGKYGKPQSYWDKFQKAISDNTAKFIRKEAHWKPGKPKEKAVQIKSTAFRVPNPEVTDQINTIEKMAQKRAFVSAILIASGASTFFTVDVEDIEELGGVKDWLPDWSEFFRTVTPGLKSLLKGTDTQVEQVGLLKKLLSQKFDGFLGKPWDPQLATEAHTYLRELEKQASDEMIVAAVTGQDEAG